MDPFSTQYEQWKKDKSIAMARFVGKFSIVSPTYPHNPLSRSYHRQYKSTTSGHTGTLGEISKQEVESAFFGDDKNVKDKSTE
jgi:hypothetical protein